MIKIIPRELIRHFEWEPGQEVPVRTPVSPTPTPQSSLLYSIDDILKGKPFHDDSLPIALKNALEYATSEGIIVTMPELIAAKLKADNNHDFWKKWHSVHTEENMGIDKHGKFVSRGKPVVITLHGGGILTPDRIQQAYKDSLINGSAKYSDKEFDDLLVGKLPNEESVQLYTLDELKEGISDMPRRYGIIMPFEIAQATESGYHKKRGFMENPLVLARAGGMEHLEAYYERAKDSENDLGNWHPFKGRDPTQPQGRVLFLYYYYDGLSGNCSLSNDGRFVGVAPEAHSVARK